MSQEIVKALRDVDAFHKNCQLLFHDIESSIRQNTLLETIKDPVVFQLWCMVERATNASNSEHRGNFVFDHDDRIRFVFMLVKTHENHLRSQSAGFKAICQ